MSQCSARLLQQVGPHGASEKPGRGRTRICLPPELHRDSFREPGDRPGPPRRGHRCPEIRACATSEANTLPGMPLRGWRGRTHPHKAHVTVIFSLPNQHARCRGPRPPKSPPDQGLRCAGAWRVQYRLSPLWSSFPAHTRALWGCGGRAEREVG